MINYTLVILISQKNGTSGYLEHWYFHDFGNIRFVSLDTNWQYRNSTAQLNWLNNILKEASSNESIDFVIAQFHHPHESELWVKGEVEYSGKISDMLAQFTKKTGKPTLYFCGHTHGYSRAITRMLIIQCLWSEVSVGRLMIGEIINKEIIQIILNH